MECENIRKLLSDYFDNELGPERRKIVEGHIAGCQVCSGEFQRLKDLISAVGEVGEVSPPPDFAEAVQGRIEARASMEKFLKRLFYPPYIKLPIEAVAVCATILIAFYFANQMGLVKGPVYLAEKEKDFALAKKSERTFGVVTGGAVKLGVSEEAKAPAPRMLSKQAVAPKERKPSQEEKEQVVVFSCLDVDKALKDISMVVAMLEGSFEYQELKPIAQEGAEIVTYNGAGGALYDYRADRLAPLTKSLLLQIPADRLPVFLTELQQMGTIISMPAEISPKVLMNVMSLMNRNERAILREKFVAIRLEIEVAK